MESLEPDVATRDNREIKKFVKKSGRIKKWIGGFYKLLDNEQQIRFRKLLHAWCEKFSIPLSPDQYNKDSQETLELLLLKQIALNTIRIEMAEYLILGDKTSQYTKVEDYYLAYQKERREAIRLFYSIIHSAKKKKSVISLDEVRNRLREDKGLDNVETTVQPDKFDRDRRIDKEVVLRVAHKTGNG